MEDIIDILCGGKKSLIESYNKDKPTDFRKQLKNQEDVDKAVRVYITRIINDVMLYVIGIITRQMKPMGDMIIAGTAAFNEYLPKNKQTPTTDIDTKFVPEFVVKGKVVSTRSTKYYEYLQIAKILMWTYLGKICKPLDGWLVKAFTKKSDSKFESMVGLRERKPPLTSRRYTYIPKKRQNRTKSTPSEDNVLVDIELMAIDMKMSYIDVKTSKIKSQPFNGILDIAFMRRHEFGWDVIKDKRLGLTYTNPVTGKLMHDKKIMVASPRFLLEDVYDIIKLGIRQKKKTKDVEKFKLFAKEVFNIKTTNSINKIYKIASKKPSSRVINRRPPFIYKKYLRMAKSANAYNYNNRISLTTDPNTVMTRFLMGLVTPNGLQSNNFYRTSGNSRFNLKSRQWVTNKTNSYIKNEMLYRPSKSFESKLKWKNRILDPNPINYNPRRNVNMNNRIKNTAAILPLTGLRD